MLKVAIVDDDFTARSNFKTMIDWKKYDFSLCGEATNGQEAITMIEDQRPDIVITDMNMPIMDGIALIEYMGIHYPDIKSVALSGYDDFNYVKESLKNGAVDYLLKHKLDDVSLLKVLKVARDKITWEHKRQEHFVQSRKVLRQDFIKRLVLGDISDKKAIRLKIKELELSLDESPLAMVVVEIDDFILIKKRFTEDQGRGLISSVIDLTEEILRDMGNAVMAFVDEGRFVIIFHFKVRSELYIYNHVATTVKRIRESIKRYLNITACFSLDKIFYDISDSDKCYKAADQILCNKISTERDKIFNEVTHHSNTVEYFNLDVKDEKQIMLGIQCGDRGKIQQYLDRIFTRMIELKVSYKSVQMICIELIGIANRIARESAIDVKDLYNNNDIPYDDMRKNETLLTVKTWITTVYEKLINLLLGVTDNRNYTEHTRKTLEYLQRNYANPLSLHQIAEDIGVNSCYLSRIFKEDCGLGFAEYLTMIRVKQAKLLMEKTDSKLKEIVKQVGFNNYTYFFKVFKIVVGVTPVEYKEKCKNTALV